MTRAFLVDETPTKNTCVHELICVTYIAVNVPAVGPAKNVQHGEKSC